MSDQDVRRGDAYFEALLKIQSLLADTPHYAPARQMAQDAIDSLKAPETATSGPLTTAPA